MRLVELIVESSGLNGWHSKILRFGQKITQLYGPNGCGKTPVIQSIVFALGYPVKYRDDVYANCGFVVLKAQVGDLPLVIRRKIDTDFYIQCLFNGDNKIFYDEREFSQYLLGILNLDCPTLTSNSSQTASPYLATILPLFYLDQDIGYSSIYKAPASFIKDQHVEMIRILLGVPPKNSYDQKKLVFEAKERLDQMDRAIVRSREFIEKLIVEVGGFDKSSDDLDKELTLLKNKLDGLRDKGDAKSEVDSALSYLINERKHEKSAVDWEAREISDRLSGFEKIKNEIEVEINTLSLNEEARRLFTSFEEICSNSGCGLFLGSSESYGKNLLYLKDQVKDLERNTTYQRRRIEELCARSESIAGEIMALEEKLSLLDTSGSVDGLVQAIGELTREIFETQKQKQIVDQVESEKSLYVGYLNDREKIQNDIASLAGTAGAVDLRIVEFRSQLKVSIAKWLDVLNTRNVSRDIQIDSDFNVQFGTEKVNQFKGSTLLRVILSVRAAFFEIYVSKNAVAFEFLIFDTPRQQDIEGADFAKFIAALKELSATRNVQVIFSTTEYHYQAGDGDIEWIPEFPGVEQNMFLGVQGT